MIGGDRNAQVWLTAVGARVVGPDGRPVGGAGAARLQCSAMAFLNRLTARRELGITRLYYYNFQSLGNPVQDFGLVDRASRPRPAFYRFAQRSGAPC